MPEEDHLTLEHQLCVALYGASRAVTGAYRPLLAEIGLTYSQYAVMLHLWHHGTTTLRDLGVALHLDSGTLSPLLKRLEDRGLVTRRRDRADERVLQVVITDAGTDLQERAREVQLRVETMTGLDPQALARLRDQLNQLSETIRRAQPGRDGLPGSAA